MNSIVEDFKTTSGFNLQKLLTVNSLKTLIVALIISVGCPTCFFHIQQAIYKGVPNLGSDIHKYDMFDLQSFYTPSSVKITLDGWGNHGIALFYIIQFIDVFVFCFAYRTLFVVLLNLLLNYLSGVISKSIMSKLHYLIAYPMLVTLLDYAEDSAQVAMCLVYQSRKRVVNENDALWVNMVNIASTMNLVKWISVVVGLLFFVLLIVLTLFTFIGKLFKNSKEN